MVSDGTDNSSPATRLISITAVNDAPLVTTTSAPLNYSEQTNSIIDSGLTLSDVDSNQISSATISITSGFVASQDRLNFTGLAGITGNYNSTTGVLTLSGTASLTNYESALRSITYRNSSNAPDTTPRTISFVVNDGTDASLPSTRDITINPSNDAPLVDAPLSDTTPLNTGLVFSSANGNAVTISDPDLGSVEVTLSVTSGSLNLNGTSNLTFTTGSGVSDTTMTFSGSLNDINSALNGLSFDPDTAFTGTVSFQISVDDQGNTGSGIPLVDSTTVLIAVGNTTPVATDDPGDYAALLSALNPVSNWRLGDTVGTTIVDSGSAAANGTLNGPALAQTGALNGDSNTAVRFDGIDDYIEIPHATDFLLDDGTIQFWFNADSTGTQQALLSKDYTGLGTGGHLTIWLTGSGTIQTRLQSTTAEYYVETSSPVTAGQWHHIAFSFGSNGMELYVDGVLTDVNGYTGGLGTTSGGTGNIESFVLGATNWQGSQGNISAINRFFGGSLDEVSIVGSQLNADQIRNSFTAGLQNFTLAENTTLTVTGAEGVLINDADADGDTLSAVLVSGPSYASAFTFNPDGSFDYTPIAGFDGTDSFTYRASDGTNSSSIATVTITVTGINEAPVITSNGGGTTATINVAENDTAVTDVDATDAELDTLAYSITGGADAALFSIDSVTGLLSFTTAADFELPGDSDANNIYDVIVQVTDGSNIDTQAIAITITNVNEAPVTTGIADISVDEDAADTIIDLFAAFSDAEDSAAQLSYSLVANSNPALFGRTSIDSVSGTLTLEYAADQNGSSNLTVRATDSSGMSVDAGFSVTVNAVNDAPTILLPALASTVTGVPLVFSSTTANAVTVNDIDNPNAVVEITLLSNEGELTLATTNGLSFTSGDGTRDTRMTFTGTLAAINTALEGMQLDTGSNFQGNLNLTISVDDLGNTGGPALVTTNTLAISVDAVQTDPGQPIIPGNNPPVAAVDPVDADPVATTAGETPQAPPSQGQALELEPNTDTPSRTPAVSQEQAAPAVAPPVPENQFFEVLAEKLQAIPADILKTVINKIDIPTPMLPIASNLAMWNAIDAMLEELDDNYTESQTHEMIMANVVRGATWSLSAGFVAWILRGGTLLAAAMSSIPIWKGLDPLPIIALSKRERKRRDAEHDVDKQEEDSLQQEIGELIDGAKLADKYQTRDSDT